MLLKKRAFSFIVVFLCVFLLNARLTYAGIFDSITKSVTNIFDSTKTKVNNIINPSANSSIPEAGTLISEKNKYPVVLVHGHTGSILGDFSVDAYWLYIHNELVKDGFKSYKITLPDAAWGDVKVSAQALASFISKVLAETKAQKVDVVVHSEGGLVTRYYIQNLGGLPYIDDLVTISTPHRGTVIANVGQISGDAAKQMSVGSDFLKVLNADDWTPGNINYTAIYSILDGIVTPGYNAHYDGAVNTVFTLSNHATILFNPHVYKIVKAALTTDLADNSALPIQIAKNYRSDFSSFKQINSTNSKTVQLKIKPFNHYTPNFKPKEMMISDNITFLGANWETLKSEKSWNISTRTEGLKMVYVKFREEKKGLAAFTPEMLPVYSDYIYYDKTSPKGKLAINSNAKETSVQTVKLLIAATDNTDSQKDFKVLNTLKSYGIFGIGVREMMISNFSDFKDAKWQMYASEIANWQLTSGYGPKTVYLKLKDAAGNISSVISANIKLNSGTIFKISKSTKATKNTNREINSDSEVLQEVTVDFTKGWNLVFMPFFPEFIDANNVMESLKSVNALYKVNNKMYDFAGLLAANSSGQAFWTFLNQDFALQFVPDSDLINTSVSSELKLAAGWNIVGSPLLKAVPWGDNIIFNCGSGDTVLSNAVNNGLFDGNLYSYDDVTGEYLKENEILPFKGYFLKLNQSCNIKFNN